MFFPFKNYETVSFSETGATNTDIYTASTRVMVMAKLATNTASTEFASLEIDASNVFLVSGQEVNGAYPGVSSGTVILESGEDIFYRGESGAAMSGDLHIFELPTNV